MATTFLLFGSLPTELKTHILRQRLVFDGPITERSHPSHAARSPIPLALTCKELRILAQQIYYEENTFVASRARDTWHYPNPAVGAQVRKLQIGITFKGYRPWAGVDILPPVWIYRAANDWLYLLGIPSHDLDGTSWQRNFPRLDSLKIIVSVDNSQDGRGTWSHKEMETLARYHVRLKAKRVEVVVEGIKSCLDMRSNREARLPGGECCKAKIASIIRNKIGIGR